MKRVVCVIFAFLLLSQISSCSETKEDNSEASSVIETVETVPEETETESPYLDHIPDAVDFSGEICNMLIRTERIDDMFQEEMVGEIVADAIWERTIQIEDRLNLSFTTVELPSDASMWKNTIAGSVQAADGAYDIVFPDYWWGIELGGYFCNLLNLPYLDFSQPYWCAGWNDNDTFYGQLYTAVGDFSLDLVVNTEAVFFNKKLIEDFGLENPYELVKEDRWVSDKLIEMSETALADLNGDGKYSIRDDLYGLTYLLHGGRGFLYAYGMRLANKTDDGGWDLNYYDDHFVKIYETAFNMHNNISSFYYSSLTSSDERFASGKLLFYVAAIGAARGTALRDMEDDFGLVPYPKLDETQKEFISYNLGTSYAAVLISAKNSDLSAAALEALSAANRKNVVPVLYEDALKEKYSRDEVTAEMLDILSRNIYYDFAYVNDAALSSLCNVYFDAIVAANPNVSSIYKSHDRMSRKLLEKLLDRYR